MSAASEAGLWAQYDRRSANAKARAKQRMIILMEIEEQVGAGSGRTAASEAVARKHGVSLRSISDWRALVKGVPRHNWLPCLVSQYKGGRKK